MRFWLVVLTATLFSAGCFDHRYVINLSSSAKFDHASNDGVVVLKGPLATYTISAGHADRDGWARVAQWREHQINPVDGYVVLRLPPRTGADSYGIVAIRPAHDASPLSTKNYEVDRGRELPTFHAVPGQITYVGSLGFDEIGDELRVSAEPDTGPEDARLVAGYLARKYPGVRGDLAVEVFRMVVRSR